MITKNEKINVKKIFFKSLLKYYFFKLIIMKGDK